MPICCRNATEKREETGIYYFYFFIIIEKSHEASPSDV